MDNCVIGTIIKLSCVGRSKLVDSPSQFGAGESHAGGQTTTTSGGTCVVDCVTSDQNVSNNGVNTSPCVFSECSYDVINTIKTLLPHNVGNQHECAKLRNGECQSRISSVDTCRRCTFN